MGSSGNKRLALLAGAGRLPVLVAEAAIEQGYEVVAFGFTGMIAPALSGVASAVHDEPFCKLGALFARIEDEGIKQAVTIGGIAQTSFIGGMPQFDEAALDLWSRLPDRRVDSIMRVLIDDLARRGVVMLTALKFLGRHLAPAGPFTRRKPTDKEWDDIRFGFRMAKAVGGLDVGQTVVVKHRAVMAVEAVEGTDQAIRRGSGLAGGQAVVVKVAKPGQDLRFDVPAVGLETLLTMKDSKAEVLAVEAGIVLMVERDEMVARANELDLAMVGVGREVDDD